MSTPVPTQENEAATETTRGPTGSPALWERILGLLEQDLAARRDEKVFVEVQDSESGSSNEKEIGDLSASERRGLPPVLKEDVAERLLERYLAEQGYVDLLERRRAYTKKIEDLSPEDLPALVRADQQRVAERQREGRQRAEFVQQALAELDLLLAGGLAETVSQTKKEVSQ
jgi:hypothetical protein